MKKLTAKDWVKAMYLLTCIFSFTFGGMLLGVAFFQVSDHPIMALTIGVLLMNHHNNSYLRYLDLLEEEEGPIKTDI